MSKRSMVLAGALALALIGIAAIAQADQPGSGSPGSWWDQMTDHHRQVVEDGWWDEMSEMMQEYHGVDAEELEGHWDEMSEWMGGLGDLDAEDVEEMMEGPHETGLGPGMQGADDAWSGGHCGGGRSRQA